MAEEQNTDLEEQPEGTESPDKTDGTVSEQEAVDEAIKDAEPKTYTEEQFSGLLRDKQLAESTRQQAVAEAAAAREFSEQLRRDLEEARKPKETELSEEDALEGVTRGELHQFGKNLVENVTKAISRQRETDKAATLKERRAQDATNLKKTHNVKTMGQGLDAQTVIDEGASYLQMNHPTLFKAAMEGPNAASELYKLCTTFVPDIIKRVAVRNNAHLAIKLDESDGTPPSGSSPSATPGESLLEGILLGSVTEADCNKMILGAQT